MDAEQLFLHTLRDLEERMHSTDEYTVLMSAALLRKLLFDKLKLIDQANRPHQLKMTFRISDVSPFEQMTYDNPPVFWIIEDALDPSSPFAFNSYDATRDQFINRRVMYCDGHWTTIRGVVDYFANTAGAVHHGPARHERQRVLDTAAAFYGNRGLPGALHQMKMIGRLTVAGVKPLRDAVLASRATS